MSSLVGICALGASGSAATILQVVALQAMSCRRFDHIICAATPARFRSVPGDTGSGKGQQGSEALRAKQCSFQLPIDREKEGSVHGEMQ